MLCLLTSCLKGEFAPFGRYLKDEKGTLKGALRVP